jgi:eukaryotic-like serine/threonine-protein kinase
MAGPEPGDRKTTGAGDSGSEMTVADVGPNGHPKPPGSTRTGEVGPGPADGGAHLVGDRSASAVDSEDATLSRQVDAAPPPRPAPTIPGYLIEGELGRGAMGIVYLARQARLNRPCALKVILAGVHADPVATVRFLGEAEAVARLQHPHIVQIHHTGEADGLPFLELEYLPGGSLDRTLDGTPWPARRAAALIEAVARGAAEAHRLGIIHRDLKPSNILIAADGTPKIADFGVAKSLLVESGLTATDAILGSPSYMAPEQAEGKAKQVGPLADVYALGAILYELLVGRPPFRGTTVLETLEQVRTAEAVPPRRLVPGLPRDAETIAMKCLQKDPARRYGSADALAEDLRRFLAGEPILARRTGPVERAWRTCKRNPVIATMAAGLLLALLIGLAGTTSQWVRAEKVSEELRTTLRNVRYDSYVNALPSAQLAWDHAEFPRMRELLNQQLPKPGEADLRGFEWDYLRRLSGNPNELLTYRAHGSGVIYRRRSSTSFGVLG